ncbi:hypothetical protein HID58_016696, partial [Brassica napus]
MANSFILLALAEFKNIDQSLSKCLEDQRIDLLEDDRLRYVISDATEIVPTRLSMLTYNIDANITRLHSFVVSLQLELYLMLKTRTSILRQSPQWYTIFHTTSLPLGFMGVLCDRGIEFDVLDSSKMIIYVEEVKSSLSNAFFQADIALAEDRNRGSFLRLFFWYLGSCCPYFWKVCFLMIVVLFLHLNLMVAKAADGRAILCRNGEAIDMSRDHKQSTYRKEESLRKWRLQRCQLLKWHSDWDMVTISTLSRARRSKDTFNRGRQVSNDGMRGDLGRFDNSKGFCIVRFELHRSRSDNACLRSLRLNKAMVAPRWRINGRESWCVFVYRFRCFRPVLNSGVASALPMNVRLCFWEAVASIAPSSPAFVSGGDGFLNIAFAGSLPGFSRYLDLRFRAYLFPASRSDTPMILHPQSLDRSIKMSVVPCKYVGGLKIDCRRLNSSSIRRSATSDFAARALALTVLVERFVSSSSSPS